MRIWQRDALPPKEGAMIVIGPTRPGPCVETEP